MYQNSRPIGVIDSGVGGLTVVRQIQRLLPGEDIIFFGDSANCPYGNRSADEIYALALRMLRYLESQEVKCVAIACNTISSLVDRLRGECPFSLVSIIESGADYVVREKLPSVGLIGTEFTVSAGVYDARIHAGAPNCLVVSKGSADLASLIDRGDFNQSVINEEITAQVDVILSRAPVKDLVLACTHFPIVADNFRACFPQLRLIDPAEQQALSVKNLLVYRSLTNPQTRGKLKICTSGGLEVYLTVSKLLGLHGPESCQVVSLEN
ncbi:MAG: glutamate racemase [Ruminococcaceae bacterium]|nr:glutamate racemase [Oscillospiraceae bacterium]